MTKLGSRLFPSVDLIALCPNCLGIYFFASIFFDNFVFIKICLYFMKKCIIDFEVASVNHLNSHSVLLKLASANPLPEIKPGQFVQVRVDGSPSTFLRRPISINYVDYDNRQIWLLVSVVGEGTCHLSQLAPGDQLNCVLPLGNGFPQYSPTMGDVLLVGGGVGVAPLLHLGHYIKENGGKPSFLLGAKTAEDLLELDLFGALGDLYITTEDESMGEKGFVTNHSALRDKSFDLVMTCGPKPMMVAVARWCAQVGIECYASLENRMACGIGACLCCVENTTQGNLCVCTEGPVFNTKMLKW